MKIIDNTLTRINSFQQDHAVIGLPYAIIKRFSEQKAGYQAALITYYGFLSLFPLLLVAASIVGLLVQNNHELETKIMATISTYFPVIGEQLTENIHASSASGWPLVIGMIIALYGARGGMDAFRSAINHVWGISSSKQPGFPESLFTSIAMIIVGGIGLYSAALLSTYTAGLGSSLFFKLLSLIVSIGLLLPTFYFLFTAALGLHAANHTDRMLMAATSTVGIVTVQGIGGYLVTSQLNKLSPLYGTFALVLGLLFWIYLQAVIVMYCAETRVVRKYKLWPRSLVGKLITEGDRQAARR